LQANTKESGFKNCSVYSEEGKEKAVSVSDSVLVWVVVKMNEDVILPATDSQMGLNDQFVKDLTDFEETLNLSTDMGMRYGIEKLRG
jgi:hypothetical protein